MPLSSDLREIRDDVRDHVSGHIANVLPGQETLLSQPVDPRRNKVWLLDSTAYYEPKRGWKAQVIACAFKADHDDSAAAGKKVDEAIAGVADFIGSKKGEKNNDDAATRKRMEERLAPFLDPVSPGRLVRIDIPTLDQNYTYQIGPGDSSGVATQVLTLPPPSPSNSGQTLLLHPCLHNWPSRSSMDLRFEGPEGYLIISDIDDTIKRTQTPDPTGIVRTTFVDDPQPIPLMPQLYGHIDHELDRPAWFFLSASPYNLYPFLRKFLRTTGYPAGMLMLRTSSVTDPTGLVETITQGTYEFKTSQIAGKIHGWFPRRKVICVGDSTQKDPETYADMYKKFPGWIKAIFIRRVTDAPHMKEKNKQERFDEAFKGVAPYVYTVFDSPNELQHLIGGLRYR